MSDYIETQNKIFRPVRCTETNLASLETVDGYLYFTTDTQKIFLGCGNEKLEMCESKGFYYGKKPITYENNGVTPDPIVKFLCSMDESVSELEGTNIPELDDLILNIGTSDKPDGCFYRVTNIAYDDVSDTTILTTTRLTLQGSGGGGGGGGGSSTTNFTLTIDGSTKKIFSSQAPSMPISFRCNYIGQQENGIKRVSFILSGATEAFYEEYNNSEIGFNKINTLDLVKYIELFNDTKKTVTLEVEDEWNTVRSTTFSIQLLDLILSQTEDSILSSFSSTTGKNELDYGCELYGASEEIETKTVYYTFYKEDNLITPYKDPFEKLLDATTQGTIKEVLNLSDFEHGVYVLKISAMVKVKNSNLTILSNEIIHKVGVYTGEGNKPLLVVKLPEKAEMHTNIPVNYKLISSETNKKYTMQIKINGNEKTKLNIATNILSTYDFYFEEKENKQYTLLFAIIELNEEYFETLLVKAYQGSVPVIDPNRSDLMLYLNPRERSNDEVDKNIWCDYSNRTNEKGEVLAAKLNNFHYGSVNGWMKDSDGANYLLLSSGASLNVSNFTPFQTDFSQLGKYGMTIELDFEVDKVLNYEAELIKCISTNDSKTTNYVGFGITGNRIYFYNDRLNGGDKGALMSVNLVEGKRIRVSFVIEPRKASADWFPMCYTYLNGILSSAVLYQDGDGFQDGNIPARLNIDSTNGNIKIYSIRFYNTALSHREVLNNFTASFANAEDKKEKYETNNVFNAGSGKIDFNLVTAEDYDLQIPYMKITGGWSTLKDSKWKLQNQQNANAGLPTGKKDYRLIDIEVKYPDNEYFKKYSDYKFTNQFASGNNMAEAYGETPSNGGCIMYAQGTSSMEYPVKNLRIRFKKDKDFFRVRPDIEPVEIICMKADYMESSGSHNTGTGNLIDALYEGVNLQTPGQKQFDADDAKIVTCIKGHPCLIFYSETGRPGTYEYIGKYNLNLDKATPEPFGFNHVDGFGYLPVGTQYYDESANYDEEGNYTGTNRYSAGDPVTVDKENDVNSIYCFEFLDNAVEVCNFISRQGLDYEQTWYNTFKNKENEDVPGWTLGFESRYPKDKVGYHDADALWPLASWIHNLYNLYLDEAVLKYEYELATTYNSATRYYIKIVNGQEVIYEIAYPSAADFALGEYYTKKTIWKPREQILEKEYEYTYTPVYEFKPDAQISYYVQNERTGEWEEVYPTSGADFNTGKYHTRAIKYEGFKLKSLERFKKEYQCYFNKDFLLTYYLVTEALLMADSRVKNMMIATWGQETKTYYDVEDKYNTTPKTMTNYIWYPIFYDMDTMMGLDNTGVYRFNYYDEDTDATLFNGDEVLWILVRDALQSELTTWYSKLEGSLLTVGKDSKTGQDIGILPYYNNNQANMANEAFYNGDADYKYVSPARSGYRDDSTGKDIDPGIGPYLYAAQGDRSLMREWFITNRIKFLQGKYNSSKYKTNDRIEFRWYYPTDGRVVAPSPEFNFQAIKTGHAGVLLGANGNVYNQRFEKAGDTATIRLPEAAGANGTEAYILGVSTLSDLGDLSNKYMQKLVIGSDDVRLEKLKLGNGTKGYNNEFWKAGEGQSSIIDVARCSTLKEFNLENCRDYNGFLNFSNCAAIEKIYLTGSGVTSVELPINGVIEELRLPLSVNALRINSHSALTDDNFSWGTFEYEDGVQMWHGDTETNKRVGYYNNSFDHLDALNVINTNIDTYRMVRAAKDLRTYCLQGVNWTITDTDTQYCIINESEFQSDRIYYYLDNGIYKEYKGNEYPEDGSDITLYEKYTMTNGAGRIECIPVLEKLRKLKLDTKYNSALTQAEALTGNIVISIPETSVVELDIYNRYHDIYPNLTISYDEENVEVKEASKIAFYRVDEETLQQSGQIDSIQPYYTALTNGTKTLAKLIESEVFVNPTKTSTSQYEYKFTGIWIDWKTGLEYYQDDQTTEEVLDVNALNSSQKERLFSVYIPEEHMQLVPRFSRHDKMYTVEFYNEGFPNTVELLFTIQGSYEQSVAEALIGKPEEPYGYFNYIEKEGLGKYERYAFKGWIKQTDLEQGNITALDNIKITGNNLKLIAKYVTEDVRYNESDIRYFEATNGVLSLNPKYKYLLKGKITLPVDYNGAIVHTIGSFGPELTSQQGTNYTGIYFREDVPSTYTTVGANAFAHWYGRELSTEEGFSKLHTITLPSTITTIKRSAFGGCLLLQNVGDISNVTTIESAAFQKTGRVILNLDNTSITTKDGFGGTSTFSDAGDGVTLTSLPSTIDSLGSYIFKGCKNVKITDFTYLVNGIGESCFEDAGAGVESIRGVTSNISTIKKDAFKNYGTPTMNIEWNGTTPTDIEQLEKIGLNRQSTTQSNVEGEV